LWARVAKAGKPYNIGPGTPNYIERIESGLISYGADTDAKTNPFELGMDKFIALDQPHDFIGKDALIALKRAGVTRRFMGLIIDGPRIMQTSEDRQTITFNGADAGYVSACVYSPRVGENIGVGMVATAAIDALEPVEIMMEEGPRSGRIVSLPFI